MKRFVVTTVVTVLTGVSVWQANFAAPVDVTEAVILEDLVAATESAIEDLGKAVESDESFARAVEYKTIATQAGLVACLSQAVAEHKGNEKASFYGPAVRDAALALRNVKTLEDARSGLDKVKSAMTGGRTDAPVEFAWNKLINMHRMMEEMESREASLRKSLKRPRRLENDSVHATAAVVLGLAMEADTHEVKNPAEVPQWVEWARKYHTNMSALAAAMKAGKAEEAQKLFAGSAQVCTDCHEKFRD